MRTGRTLWLFLLIPGNILALILALLGKEALKTNLLGGFLLLIGIAYMVVGIIIFRRENSKLISRSDRAAQEEKGDRSFWLIIPGFVAAFFASPVEYLYLGGETRAGFAAQVAGMALILPGLALRIWTRVTLKSQYTGHVQVAEGEKLQTGGPYRYIRHPGYAGYLLFTLGLAVGFGSYLGLATIFLLLLPGLAYRMRVEEKILTAQFADEYPIYAAKTKKIIPGIW